MEETERSHVDIEEMEQTSPDIKETEQDPVDDEELLRCAVQIAIDQRRIKVPMLMRFLQIGYTRSSRLIDMMEERKFVTPRNEKGSHDTLIGWDEFEAIYGPRDERYNIDIDQIMKSILEGNTRV